MEPIITSGVNFNEAVFLFSFRTESVLDNNRTNGSSSGPFPLLHRRANQSSHCDEIYRRRKMHLMSFYFHYCPLCICSFLIIRFRRVLMEYAFQSSSESTWKAVNLWKILRTNPQRFLNLQHTVVSQDPLSLATWEDFSLVLRPMPQY